MKKFMLQLFRTVVTLVILVVMALMIFDLRTRLNEAKRELIRTQQELAWTRQLLEERQQRDAPKDAACASDAPAEPAADANADVDVPAAKTNGHDAGL